jgi:hypothetical protein
VAGSRLAEVSSVGTRPTSSMFVSILAIGGSLVWCKAGGVVIRDSMVELEWQSAC